MRADPALFELVSATSLQDALDRLAKEPGLHTPFAGGTELMVAFNSGRLIGRSFLSLHNLAELRCISVAEDAVRIGAGTTFTEIRHHPALLERWPLLPQAASWTGSIANQNRATLGGNLVNASPAADTPPVLLAYDASVTLISVRGTRTLPYRDFHLGYKRTALSPDELLLEVSVPSTKTDTHQYLRKVGTRQAQAISKVALAGLICTEENHVGEVRLGAASLGDRPLRLEATEDTLRGASLDVNQLDVTVRRARAALATEVKPIDDIRSTAAYRSTVAGNLLEEFLRQLSR